MSSNNFFSLVKDEPRSPSELETRVVTMAPSNPMAIPGTPGGPSATPQGVATAVSQVGTPLQGPPMGSMTPGSLHPQALHRIDVDPNFEPVPRSRSNTWPLPCPEGYVEGDEGVGGMDPTAPTDHARTPGTPGGVPGDSGTGPPKKNTSRRNPWGNMSYADLIAQAIMSSPDGRATLSQIYDWMVQNVPYFKDKGDSNSSAGWKVGSNS
ncbi:forkhead box protein O6-like [Oratosquilla oratoria]|uniref:forkhead box protein O6-like n=1 Tax=Oratosquilla oratoria TaxID=337810 RepID=UPI003F76D08C